MEKKLIEISVDFRLVSINGHRCVEFTYLGEEKSVAYSYLEYPTEEFSDSDILNMFFKTY